MAFHEPTRRATGGTTAGQDPWPLGQTSAVVAAGPAFSQVSRAVSPPGSSSSPSLQQPGESNVSTWGGDSRPRKGIPTPRCGPCAPASAFPRPRLAPAAPRPAGHAPFGLRGKATAEVPPREAFWANPREAATGPSQSAPALFPGPTRPGLFSLPPSAVPVVAAVGPAACAAPAVRGLPARWRPRVPPAAFTEDVSLRGRVRTPRRPPARFHLATGEGGSPPRAQRAQMAASRQPGWREGRATGRRSLPGGCGRAGRGEGARRRPDCRASAETLRGGRRAGLRSRLPAAARRGEWCGGRRAALETCPARPLTPPSASFR